MKTHVRHGSSQPDQLRRDEFYIQHASQSSKVLGVWVGNKSDKRKCINNKAVRHGADATDVAMKAEDRYAGLDTSTGVATATLPPVADIEDGHIATVKDEGGNAGTNNITIATDGAETTDVATIATNGGAAHLMWDKANSNWVDVS